MSAPGPKREGGGARAADAAWRLALRLAYRGLRLAWRVTRPYHEGTLVAVWSGERVLLVRNSYRRELTFPGGSRRRGEAPVQTAARELAEEVGIVAAPGVLQDRGVLRARYHHQDDHCRFFELHLEADPRPVPDRREVVAAWLAHPGEALALPLVPVTRLYLERHGSPGAAPHGTPGAPRL